LQARKRGVGGATVAVVMAAVVILAAAAVIYSGSQRVTETVTVSPVTTTETTTETSTLTVTQTLTTVSTSSLSCSATTSTTSAAASSPADRALVDLARNFTSVSLAYGENSSGKPVVIDQTYSLAYASPTTYKMTFSLSGSSSPVLTAWVLSNGTIVAADSGGKNYSGSSASSLVETSAPVFYEPLPALNPDSQISFPVDDLHATGSSNVTLGNTQVSVTNYRANSLPLVFCQGTVLFDLNTVVFQTAPVPGRDFSLITYADLQGTMSSSPYSFYLSILSITEA
jgi:hypothetical protein